MNILPITEVREVDVGIVGSGCAGLSAALTVKQQGLSVLVLSKSQIGLGSSSAMASGTFRAALGSYTKEMHYLDTESAGRRMCDPDLVNALVDDAPNRVLDLVTIGVPLKLVDGGAELSGHHIEPSPGKKVTAALKNEALKLEIELLDGVKVIDILENHGRVCGIVVYRKWDNCFSIIKMGSIILASGGLGGIFPYTTNPRHNIGDGYAMALRAGCALQDLEFIQFMPFGVVESGLPKMLIPMEVLDFIPLVNERGDEFMIPYLRNLGLEKMSEIGRYARDLATQAIWKEIGEGRGNNAAVLLCLSRVEPKAWENPVMAYFRKQILKKFPLMRDLHIAPLAHYTIGGIPITPNSQASMDGLYGAGEVTTGLHGANRLGGNALTEALVFGARAGLSAAVYSFERHKNDIDPSNLRAVLSRIGENISTSGNYQVKDLIDELQQAINKYLATIRSQKGLEIFLSLAERITENKKYCTKRTSGEIQLGLELDDMLLVSRAIALCAIARQESRGAHVRADFQQKSDKLDYIHFQINLEGELSRKYIPKGEFTIKRY